MRTRSILILLSIIIVATGCNPKQTAPSNDKLAQAKLTDELGRWVAGQPSKTIQHIDLMGTRLLRFDVVGAFVDSTGPSTWFENAKEGEPTYKVTANLQLESESGGPITKQMLYRVLVEKSGECRVLPAY